ncbi:MAG: GHMP kinase [Elusimicrobiota bacterium]
MQIIRAQAYARAGLIGNPSDGYNGKTISLIVKNFSAKVVLYDWPEVEIILSQQDKCRFNCIEDLVEDVKLSGYYGGLRLVKAAIKKFYEYCEKRNIKLRDRNFSIRYDSNIPRQVGLAGSSAIVTATIRGLMEFYGIAIPKNILPNLILSVENNELRITAGLQDRVCQVYEGLVYMDFDKKYMDRYGYGRYKQLNPRLLPNLFISYRTDFGEISDVVHNNVRERYLRGDTDVINAMKKFALLSYETYKLLLAGKRDAIGPLMDENFDTRRKIFSIDTKNIEMVETARKCGAHAKFAGSGGAIVGTYRDEYMLRKLYRKLSEIGCKTFIPSIV